jgi:hypothetical protein
LQPCFQTTAASAAESGENHLQHPASFMRGVLLDRLGFFFFSG